MKSIRELNDQREKDGLPPFKSYNLQLADGRELSVDATSEEHAKAIGREQGGNVGVLSVKENMDPDSGKADDADDADDDTFTPVDSSDITDDQSTTPEGTPATGLDADPSGVVSEQGQDADAITNDPTPLGGDGLPFGSQSSAAPDHDTADDQEPGASASLDDA